MSYTRWRKVLTITLWLLGLVSTIYLDKHLPDYEIAFLNVNWVYLVFALLAGVFTIRAQLTRICVYGIAVIPALVNEDPAQAIVVICIANLVDFLCQPGWARERKTQPFYYLAVHVIVMTGALYFDLRGWPLALFWYTGTGMFAWLYAGSHRGDLVVATGECVFLLCLQLIVEAPFALLIIPHSPRSLFIIIPFIISRAIRWQRSHLVDLKRTLDTTTTYLRLMLSSRGVKIKFAPCITLPSDVYGFYEPTTKMMIINDGLADIEKITTMVHETVHMLLEPYVRTTVYSHGRRFPFSRLSVSQLISEVFAYLAETICYIWLLHIRDLQVR